jgi:hypothetical protein
MCLVVSGSVEFAIYHFGYRPYLDAITILLMAGWGIGSVVLAWCEPRLAYVYWGSVVLAAPSISYSMLGYGLLPMGGLLHPFMAGIYAVPFWYLFERIRKRKLEKTAEPITGTSAS